MTKIRVRRYREKKKAALLNKTLTRQEQKVLDAERSSQREKWRIKKAEHRQRVKEAAKEVEREASEGIISLGTIRAAKARILKALPKNPDLCARALGAVLQDLDQTITNKMEGFQYNSPKSVKYRNSCLKVVEKMKDEERNLRTKRSKESRARRSLIVRFLSDEGGEMTENFDSLDLPDVMNEMDSPNSPDAMDNTESFDSCELMGDTDSLDKGGILDSTYALDKATSVNSPNMMDNTKALDSPENPQQQIMIGN